MVTKISADDLKQFQDETGIVIDPGKRRPPLDLAVLAFGLLPDAPAFAAILEYFDGDADDRAAIKQRIELVRRHGLPENSWISYADAWIARGTVLSIADILRQARERARQDKHQDG